MQRLTSLEGCLATLVEQRATDQEVQQRQQQGLAELRREMQEQFQTVQDEGDAHRKHLLEVLHAEMHTMQTALQQHIQHEGEVR